LHYHIHIIALRVAGFSISDLGFGIVKRFKGRKKIMRIRAEDLKESKLSLKFEQPPESFPVLAEMADTDVCQFLTPIRATLRAQQIGDIVEIEGSISTAVRLDCGRCLQSFEMPLESQFALTYSQIDTAPEQSDSNDEEIELTIEDMGLIHYQGEEIHLDKEIQEQVILALPLRALCKPDCKGLCPGCGADLNTAVCECERSSTGGKFEALKKLDLNKD
jgi:uncharacterized protein